MGFVTMQTAQPRLASENLEKNQKLYLALRGIASRKRCTTSQLALAWIQHQGDDVVPIPGTTKISNFDQNLASLVIKLSREDMAEIESLFDSENVAGARTAHVDLTFACSDTPPLSSWLTEASSSSY
jgi:aryl-alcohol dehydrogenase-like predicted oxidoreductase